jgi:hypothetical protein
MRSSPDQDATAANRSGESKTPGHRGRVQSVVNKGQDNITASALTTMPVASTNVHPLSVLKFAINTHTVAEVYIILARLEPACCPLAALTEPSSSRPPSAARAHAREREKRAAP